MDRRVNKRQTECGSLLWCWAARKRETETESGPQTVCAARWAQMQIFSRKLAWGTRLGLCLGSKARWAHANKFNDIKLFGGQKLGTRKVGRAAQRVKEAKRKECCAERQARPQTDILAGTYGPSGD